MLYGVGCLNYRTICFYSFKMVTFQDLYTFNALIILVFLLGNKIPITQTQARSKSILDRLCHLISSS